jgi:hypothetical protein
MTVTDAISRDIDVDLERSIGLGSLFDEEITLDMPRRLRRRRKTLLPHIYSKTAQSLLNSLLTLKITNQLPRNKRRNRVFTLWRGSA